MRRQVVHPLEAQQTPLSGLQTAIRPLAAKRPAGRVEQIHLVQRRKRVRQTRQTIARRQQGHIETFPVKCYQIGSSCSPCRRFLEQRRFTTKAGQKKLPQAQLVAINAAYS